MWVNDISLYSVYMYFLEKKDPQLGQQECLTLIWDIIKLQTMSSSCNYLVKILLVPETKANGQFHNCQSWSFITVHGQF